MCRCVLLLHACGFPWCSMARTCKAAPSLPLQLWRFHPFQRIARLCNVPVFRRYTSGEL